MSGRHSKPSFYLVHAAQLKTAGGVIAGAAIAGAIAAGTAATTPNTTPTTADHLASQRALADIAVLRADDRRLSPHEAHIRHQAHATQAKKSRLSLVESSESSRSSERRPGRARSVSAQDVLHLAKEQVGIKEDRSGTTKFNKWYMADSRAQRTLKRDGGSRAAYRDAAWCDMFVSWIGDKLGVSGTVGFDAWAVKHAEWFKDHDRWGHEPRPGAVTFFGWNGHKIDDIEHVGFTIKDNHDGTIKTVEGNTHNTVAIRTRKKSFVVGYGYPDYKK